MKSILNKKTMRLLFSIAVIAVMAAGCEKEVKIDVDKSEEKLVVEASINQFSPILNYVFITKSVDYFKPDLSMGGLDGANVTITAGRVSGRDTIYDGTRTPFYNIYAFPGADTLFAPFEEIISNLKGIYMNPTFQGVENTPYLLNITFGDGSDGRVIQGKTYIPKMVKLDTIKYEFRGGPDTSGRRDAFTSLYWVDPPEQNNYRMAIKRDYYGNILIGWGGADSYRTFDDEFLNNQQRNYSFFNPFKEFDTLTVYFTSLGRREYLFWQSFGQAANSGNPFSTPVALKSNITGAIGSFTGYSVSYKQVIFR